MIFRVVWVYLWFVLSEEIQGKLLSGQAASQDAWVAAGSLISKVLQDGLSGCHLILAASSSPTHVLTDVIRRCSESNLPAAVLVTQTVARHKAPPLGKTVWTTQRASCQALFLDITSGAQQSIRFLEESEVRLWPETRVLLVGSWTEARHVLLHHALRNTRHALHFAPSLPQPPASPDNAHRPHSANNVTGMAPEHQKQALPSTSSIHVRVLKRCLYCNASRAGVHLLYSGTLQTAMEKVDYLISSFFSRDGEQNLEGRLLRVVGLRHDPYTRYHLSPRGPAYPVTPLTSIDFSILDAVASSLNFTLGVGHCRRPHSLLGCDSLAFSKALAQKQSSGVAQQSVARSAVQLGHHAWRLSCVCATLHFRQGVARGMAGVQLRPQHSLPLLPHRPSFRPHQASPN